MRSPLSLPCIAMPFHRLLVFFVLVTVLSACIAIPTKSPDEHPFNDESLAFIEIGTTTKEQVDAAMLNFPIPEGQITMTPSLKLTPKQFNGGDWWLYPQRRGTWKWFVCAGTTAGGDCGATDRGERDYFLLIKFDDHGVVSDYDVSSLGSNGCNNSGVCMGVGQYMLLAEEGQDDLAKTFQPPNDGCSVYMYAKVGLSMEDEPFPIKVSFDDDPVISLIDDDGFLHWRAENGQHQIKIQDRDWNPFWRVAEIDCQPGDTLFVKFSISRKGKDISTGLGEDSKGRREIEKRRLVVMD